MTGEIPLKNEICDSCGRFDKDDRLCYSVERLLDEFQEKRNGEGELLVSVPKHCADPRNKLLESIQERCLDVRLRVLYVESASGAYDISDYCSE